MMSSSPLVKAMFHLSWFLTALCFLNSSALAQTCVQPPADLVSWWPGEGDAQDIIGDNHGTLENGATFAPGMVGQAFRFDGLDDYVRVPHTPLLNPPGSFTLDAWIYPTTADDAFQIIISKWGDEGEWSGQRAYIFHTWPGLALCFAISDDAHQDDTSFHMFITSANAITLNVWNHVAAVYDQATGTRRIYVNGVDVASRTDPPIALTNSIADVGLGMQLGSPSTVSFPFAGMIDEVEIFDHALTTAEIQAIYQAGSAGKCKDTEVVEVTIDIKPGSSPNSIDPKSHGVIPIAILTTDTFDAATVDPLSVRFGPKGAKEAHKKGHMKDVNHDGEPDLVLHFKTQATGIQCGQTSASLTGETFDGDPIHGTDAIQTVGCKN